MHKLIRYLKNSLGKMSKLKISQQNFIPKRVAPFLNECFPKSKSPETNYTGRKITSWTTSALVYTFLIALINQGSIRAQEYSFLHKIAPFFSEPIGNETGFSTAIAFAVDTSISSRNEYFLDQRHEKVNWKFTSDYLSRKYNIKPKSKRHRELLEHAATFQTVSAICRTIRQFRFENLHPLARKYLQDNRDSLPGFASALNEVAEIARRNNKTGADIMMEDLADLQRSDLESLGAALFQGVILDAQKNAMDDILASGLEADLRNLEESFWGAIDVKIQELPFSPNFDRFDFDYISRFDASSNGQFLSVTFRGDKKLSDVSIALETDSGLEVRCFVPSWEPGEEFGFRISREARKLYAKKFRSDAGITIAICDSNYAIVRHSMTQRPGFRLISFPETIAPVNLPFANLLSSLGPNPPKTQGVIVFDPVSVSPSASAMVARWKRLYDEDVLATMESRKEITSIMGEISQHRRLLSRDLVEVYDECKKEFRRKEIHPKLLELHSIAMRQFAKSRSTVPAASENPRSLSVLETRQEMKMFLRQQRKISRELDLPWLGDLLDDYRRQISPWPDLSLLPEPPVIDEDRLPSETADVRYSRMVDRFIELVESRLMQVEEKTWSLASNSNDPEIKKRHREELTSLRNRQEIPTWCKEELKSELASLYEKLIAAMDRVEAETGVGGEPKEEAIKLALYSAGSLL